MNRRIIGIIAAVVVLAAVILVGIKISGSHTSDTVKKNDAANENNEQYKDMNLPPFTVSGKTDLPGNFYLSFAFSRNIIMLDGSGKIVWARHEDPLPDNPYTGFWDFKKHVIDGKTYYSYHDQTGAYDNYNMEGFAPGERVILDENFEEVKRITFEESDVVEKGHPLDGKFSSACGDAQRINDDTFVVGWGRTENDSVCFSVMDFGSGKEQFSIELQNPKNFTYRCVYFE